MSLEIRVASSKSWMNGWRVLLIRIISSHHSSLRSVSRRSVRIEYRILGSQRSISNNIILTTKKDSIRITNESPSLSTISNYNSLTGQVRESTCISNSSNDYCFINFCVWVLPRLSVNCTT